MSASFLALPGTGEGHRTAYQGKLNWHKVFLSGFSRISLDVELEKGQVRMALI